MRIPHGGGRQAPALYALLALLLAAQVPEARAQESPPAPPRERGLPEVGSGDDAMPGVAGVGFALAQRHVVTGVAGLGYAFTESVLGVDDSHHRLMLPIAGAVQPLPWLAAGLGLHTRYDAHGGAPDADDSSFILETRLHGRVLHRLSDQLGLGGQLSVRVVGADGIERGLDSITFEPRLLATVLPAGAPLALAFHLGLRIDRTAHAVEDVDRLELPDRVALGASEADALLLGAGLSWPLQKALDAIAALGWDVQLGADAASLAQSPARLSGGVRYWPAPGLHVEAMAGVSPSARPRIEPSLPIYPIEPRAWLHVGIGIYAFAAPAAAAPAPPPPPAVPAAPPSGAVHGMVRDAEGQPIANARVAMGGEVVETASDGAFEVAGLPPGRLQVSVEAARFQPARLEVDVAAGKASELSVVLERALPAGQIRGTVRSFDGSPLRATVVVSPIGLELRTGPDGTFAVDVAPGEYTISIHAPGYGSQERPALVEDNGVTVIIVDLGAGR